MITEETKLAAVTCAEKHDIYHAARKFGVSAQSIEKWRAETKTDSEKVTEAPKPKKKNGHRYSDVMKAEVVAYATEHSADAAAIRYKVAKSTVILWLKNAKIAEAETGNDMLIARLEEKLREAEAECAKYREMLDIAKGLLG